MSTTETQDQTDLVPLPEKLMQMILGVWISQAIYVAAKLGIADLLKDGAKSTQELANSTSVDTQSLYRVLRALASIGIFAESESKHFELTPLAEYLRSDVPGSMRAAAMMYTGEEWHWRTWGEILYSVKTGQPTFDRLFGMPVFPYLSQNPQAATIFDQAMTSLTAKDISAIASGYDFSPIKTLVDVGGGHGSLLAAILLKNPSLKGIVYDRPQVVAGANQYLETAGVNERCQVVGGNFFESVPSGGDAYIMKHIIHNWDDERAIAILQNCYSAMPKTGKLLVVDNVIPAGNAPALGKLMDLEMLLMTSGGRERTETEFQDLFAGAGFKLTNIFPTQSSISIIEGVKA